MWPETDELDFGYVSCLAKSFSNDDDTWNGADLPEVAQDKLKSSCCDQQKQTHKQVNRTCFQNQLVPYAVDKRMCCKDQRGTYARHRHQTRGHKTYAVYGRWAYNSYDAAPTSKNGTKQKQLSNTIQGKNKHTKKKVSYSQSCKRSQLWQIYVCKNIGRFGVKSA